MTMTAQIPVQDGDRSAALRSFLAEVLALDAVDAVLVPSRLSGNGRTMPVLVTDAGALAQADPLTPAFPLNGAKLLSRLTRRPSGSRIVAVQRPCEVRAFTELVKLKQADPGDVVFVGIDCLGAFSNRDFRRFSAEHGEAATERFVRAQLGDAGPEAERPELAPACRVCEYPVPETVDLRLCLFGVDGSRQVLAEALTPAGEELLGSLGLEPVEVPNARARDVADRIGRRTRARDEMIAKTRASTGTLEKLSAYLADCINCYNCRVACPVCYCRECVFVTDVFDHEPAQYLRWAHRSGALKMPTDTLFYHLTRLVHMSTACVGCGQCSNACPNDIPVMELFRTTAEATQAAFDYRAGRSIEENPPLSEFREDEFPEVVGIE